MIPLYVLFLLIKYEPAAHMMFVVELLVISIASQVILFLFKVLPAVLSR